MADFTGKTALVTGGSSGIGRAAALAFAHAGASVVVAARGAERAERVACEIRALGGDAIACAGDVAEPADVQRFIDAASTMGGPLALACNSAGIVGSVAPIDAQSVETLDQVLRTNVRGLWLCLQAEIRAMLANGGGAIVNVSSVTGLVGVGGVSPYVASKHAVSGITKSVALEHARAGIRVNAVAPGCTRTDLLDRFGSELGGAEALKRTLSAIAEDHPIGRIAEAEEIAASIIWLCSSAASFITGQVVAVDGGQTVG
jgi:NAD(P)-dependent dehydrogenase (short-subunit alcohol dehydrogenase family)